MIGDSRRELKNALRKKILEERSRLSEKERDGRDAAICAKLFELPEFIEAELVMAYMDFRGEAGTADIIAGCFKRGKRVALPVMSAQDGDGYKLDAFETTPGGVLLRNRYGISEPGPDTAKRVAEADIGLVVVPGVAFDMKGYRLGYGAGFYDRFLTGLRPGCRTAGIAYDLQMADAIPAEGHDIPMDIIITESRVIRSRFRK